MHLINGGRLYIEPDNKNTQLEEQLHDCLKQLKQFTIGRKVYKLNFFANMSHRNYSRITKFVNAEVKANFPTPVLSSLIAQSPLTCQILVEVFYFDDSLWNHKLYHNEKGAAFVFERDGASVLVGQVQSNKGEFCNDNSLAAFRAMNLVLAKAGFSLQSVVRQWNYIENILGIEGGKQRYQEFNNIRSEFYNGSFKENGFPAATGIGILHGGVIIEFVAVNAPGSTSIPVDNPEQVAAHVYSYEVLEGGQLQHKSTPKFERARYLKLFEQKQLFVSGTASIRGERTVGTGNPEEQTHISIENIRRLYAEEVIKRIAGDTVHPSYGHARVYIKNKEHYDVVRKAFESQYLDLPCVYLIADICRNDLLVEIEGKVILE